MQARNRILSAYEVAELIKHGLDPFMVVLEDDIPIEYVTGWVSFRGREFAVSPATLIPRVETEELIALILENTAATSAQPLRIIDIGTGSGAIGISLSLELSQNNSTTYVYLSDISSEALAVARENVRRYLPQTPVTVKESDLFSAYPANQVFDMIVANLPYIPSHQMTGLDRSVQDYEPWLALDGGEYGLELIHRLLEQAPMHLSPQGVIWLEIDESHTEKMIDVSNRYQVKIFVDSFGRPRFARLQLKKSA